jgi:hypothetical protein
MALDREALAENAFKYAWARALLEDDAPATLRDKLAKAKAVEQETAWTNARNRRIACQAKCDEVRNRLMAAMSAQKFEAAQS